MKIRKFQAPKYKSQENTNDLNSKFKADKIMERYPIND